MEPSKPISLTFLRQNVIQKIFNFFRLLKNKMMK